MFFRVFFISYHTRLERGLGGNLRGSANFKDVVEP